MALADVVARARARRQVQMQSPVTYADLELLRHRQIVAMRRRRLGSTGRRLVSSGFRGLEKTRDSLKTPSTRRRPRIAQLPASRHEIPIANVRLGTGQRNLNQLKHPGLRGQTMMKRY